ncbi:50S ribosomal protein L20 [archaeon]|nr:MAG: 50S ribosomal protein L20 [archaeon]
MNPIREMANKKHKKVLKRAKGFRGRASRCFTVAFHRVQKAKQYAYRDRKVSMIPSDNISLAMIHYMSP